MPPIRCTSTTWQAIFDSGIGLEVAAYPVVRSPFRLVSKY
jgi:hypothetical protein